MTSTLFDLIDSKTVVPCYNTSNPGVALAQTKNLDAYKLYLADTGLFVSMIFNIESKVHADIYAKLLSDNLSADLGYLYENAMEQVIRALGRDLYYHSWTPTGKSHRYEVDFLLADRSKVIAVEVKSSGINAHKSISEFAKKYSHVLSRQILFSQKDVSNDGMLELKPVYLAPVVLGSLER